MSIPMLRLLAIAVLGVALAACGTKAQDPPFSVNGRPISVALYQSIVATEQHKFERTGSQVNWHSASGQRRRQRKVKNARSVTTLEGKRQEVIVALLARTLVHAARANKARFGGGNKPKAVHWSRVFL